MAETFRCSCCSKIIRKAELSRFLLEGVCSQCTPGLCDHCYQCENHCAVLRADREDARLDLVRILEAQVEQLRRREMLWIYMRKLAVVDRGHVWFGWTTSETR